MEVGFHSGGQKAVGKEQLAKSSGQFAKVSLHREFCEKYLMFVVIKNEK
jgi:hypothetical protein